MSLYVSPDGNRRLGEILRAEFAAAWTRVWFAVAYLKVSGIQHIYDVMSAFAQSPNKSVRATIGIDQHGTSYEGLATLLNVVGPNQELFVCYNPRSKAAAPSPTFHPKIWLFHGGSAAKLLTGSGNLTQGGLYTNYEVGIVQDLNLDKAADQALFHNAEAVLDRWANVARGDVRRLDLTLLNELYDANLVMSEDEIRRASRNSARTRVLAGKRAGPTVVGSSAFTGEDFEVAPAPPANWQPTAPPQRNIPATAPRALQNSVLPQHRVFYIHLNKAAKTEIYLAQAPLRDDPAFFGLPFTGRTEPRSANNPPQPQADPWPLSDVAIHDSAGAVTRTAGVRTKMWQYMEGTNANKDVRIYLTAELQRLIEEGSVCVMERDPRPGIDYAISTYAPGHPDFARYDAACNTPLPNSTRRYGWA
jgi:hypothetical protein